MCDRLCCSNSVCCDMLEARSRLLDEKVTDSQATVSASCRTSPIFSASESRRPWMAAKALFESLVGVKVEGVNLPTLRWAMCSRNVSGLPPNCRATDRCRRIRATPTSAAAINSSHIKRCHAASEALGTACRSLCKLQALAASTTKLSAQTRPQTKKCEPKEAWGFMQGLTKGVIRDEP
ncbi:hypothetical protein D3C72_1575110 [compost metagenome]